MDAQFGGVDQVLPPPPLTLPLSLYSGYLLRFPCGLEGFPEGIPQTIIFPPPHRVCCNFPESLVFPGLLYQVEKSSPEDLVMQIAAGVNH